MQKSLEHRRSVLIVDDEPGMRYMARRVFEHRFDVLDAASGEEALELLEQHEFNFAVVDVSLPGLSGLKLLSKIKEHRPNIDVVVMTGSASDPDEALEDAIRRKAFFFLRKPFPMTVLETLADRIVENQSLSERLDAQLKTLQKDLEAARIFQKRLLPPERWQGHQIEVCSRYIASDRLSGDFLDCWSLADGGSALLIADVMGHGPSSAMATAMIKSQVQRLADNLPTPGAVLSALEEDFSRHQLRGFLTTFLVFDRPARGILQYAGAGHPPARLRIGSSNEIVQLQSEGLPLNTGYDVPKRSSTEIERVPGSRILLYTDGYSEAAGPDGRFFDEPRLGEVGDGREKGVADEREESDGRDNGAVDKLEKSDEEPKRGATDETPFLLAVRRALGAPNLGESVEFLESDLAAFATGIEDDDRAVLIAELQ